LETTPLAAALNQYLKVVATVANYSISRHN
jgi:hypothetical protein